MEAVPIPAVKYYKRCVHAYEYPVSINRNNNAYCISVMRA